MTDRSRGSDRRHLHPGRPGRIAPRFTEQEMAELAAAAAAVGMTPTGFLAEAGLAAARRLPSPELDAIREDVRLLQIEFFALTNRVSRTRFVLAEAGDEPAATICARLFDAVEDVIDRVDQHLRRLLRDRTRRGREWQAFTDALSLAGTGSSPDEQPSPPS